MTGEVALVGRDSPVRPINLGSPGAVGASDRDRSITKSRERSSRSTEPGAGIGKNDWLQIPDLGVLPVAAYVCDALGAIVDYNRCAADVWGRAPMKGDAKERFCGFASRFRTDGSELPLEHSPTAHALAAGRESHGVEISVERFDGSRLTLLFNVGLVRGDRGEIVGVVTAVQEITGWKLTTESLHQTDMQEALQRFAADIAHRYCNLFAAVSSNLSMARKKSGDIGLDALLDSIGESVSKGSALTNRLRSLAQQSITATRGLGNFAGVSREQPD